MPEIEIRPAKVEEITQLKLIEHTYQTDHVWQMERSFTPGDFSIHFRVVRLPRVVRVEAPLAAHWKEEDFFGELKSLVALVNGEISGYIRITMQPEASAARVVDLAVAKKIRDQGIGSALVLSAQDWARKNQSKWVILEMQSKNYPAIRFAQKLGYEFCGYNDHYYANQDIALFFARYLR